MSNAAFQTMRHIETVRNYLTACIHELLTRQEQHDQSKLQPPEREAYDAITHLLRGTEYGSEEYWRIIRDQQPAIAHHYAHNRHHPEFHPRGYRDMTLIDLLEMLCDWKAATLRHATGDIQESLRINQQRFGYSFELLGIFQNTIDWLETQHVYHHANES